MTDEQILAYVKAAAVALELPLDDERARAVAAHLGRTATMARMLDDASLGVDDELAELYRPAPFPAASQELH